MPLAPLFAFSLLFHSLLGWRLVPALAMDSAPYAWLVGGYLLLSCVLMPMGMVALRFARAPLAEVLTWAGLLCMGVFSSLFALMVLRELLLVGLYLVQWVGHFPFDLERWRSLSAQAIAPLTLAMAVVGFWNARRTAAVVQVDVPIADLPEALQGFRIAQISDIHMGPTIKQAYLERIVARVNRLQADMVAITGDLVDGPVQSLGPLVQPLLDLRSTHGSFFVTGNHEYYSGVQGWIEKLRSLGIQVLLNQHVVLEHSSLDTSASAKLVVAGVTDYNAHHFDAAHQSSPQQALAGAPPGLRLLLAHQPRSAAAAAQAGFALQLSGHTHGGQFWPWGHFVRFQQPYTAGLHRLQGLWIYTSRGTGYWGPPKRFGAASEITLLRLVRANS